MRHLARTLLGGVLPLLALGACVSAPRSVDILATDRRTADLETYKLGRVGLLPFTGEHLTDERADGIQSAFFTELGRASDCEVVPLSPADLEEIPSSDPFRRGRYDGRTVIDVARRYNLDGVLVGTITDEQLFAPQRLSVQLDLVAAETGLVVWSAAVHLDARNEAVLDALRDLNRRSGTSEGWEVALISPSHFARFAAYQVAALFPR